MLHTMRRSLVVVVVLLVALAAMPLALAGSTHERPFKEDLTGYLTGMEMAPDGVPSYFEGRCSEPSWMVTSFGGTGTATHLGKVTWYGQHCSYAEGGRFGDAELTMVAANGDQLFATYEGGMTGPDVWLDTLTILDGTGRFQGATGEVAEEGWIDMSTGYLEVTGEGWIAYAPGR